MDNLKNIISSIDLEHNLTNFRNFLSKVDTYTILKITSGATVGLTVLYLGKIWYSYGFFKKRGIKTPKYKFISGNMHEIMNSNYSDVLRNWTKEYGKVYGYYQGHLPIMVTSDLEIIQEVFIKQFSNFTARKRIQFQESDDSPNMNLFFAFGNKWKRMRNIINPTFSPSKLKEVFPLITISSERLIDFLENFVDKEINVSNYFDTFTMDVIWNTIFGLDLDCLNNPTNVYLAKTRELVQQSDNMKSLLLFDLYFFELSPAIILVLGLVSLILGKISSKFVIPFFWLQQNVDEILKKRIQNKVNRNDFVKILLESYSDKLDTKNSNNIDKQQIEKNELTTGFEATSNALSYCMYVLTKHPEEATKLREEIEQKFPSESNVKIDFDTVSKLEYLDMFLNEVLRMYPMGNTTLARRCTVPTKVKGIDIPYDLTIAIDGLSLHYDPEIWGPVDPNEFYPLRFSDENKRNSLAFMPFGIGPRTCIGMRFALITIKLSLVKFIQKYDAVKSENTPDTLVYDEVIGRRPKYGIPILIKKESLLITIIIK